MILPKENEKDLKELPEAVVKDVELVLVETMDEVLAIALERPIEKVADSENGEGFDEPTPPEMGPQDEGNRPGVH